MATVRDRASVERRLRGEENGYPILSRIIHPQGFDAAYRLRLVALGSLFPLTEND